MKLKHEDVNFIKLKLGNNCGHTLKNVPSDRILLDRFVEIWNECSLSERSTFLSSAGSQMKMRIEVEIDKIMKPKYSAAHSVESISSRSNSQFNEEPLSPGRSNRGLLQDLFRLLTLSNGVPNTVKEVLRGLMHLSQTQTVTTRDFTNIFQGSLVESCMGRGLLTGEKFILTDQHYERFAEDIVNLVVRNNSDGGQANINVIPGGLSSVVLIYLVILEDKILDNMFYLRKLMEPHNLELLSAVTEFYERTQVQDPSIQAQISPNKSKVNSVVKPIRENHRYFKQRKVLSQINTTAFINKYQDLSIVGAFYSVDICRQKGLIDAESIIYTNFMGLNHLACDSSLEETAAEVREKLGPSPSSPSRQEIQSQWSHYNREKQSYRSGFIKNLGTPYSISSKHSNCPVYNEEEYLTSPCSSTREHPAPQEKRRQQNKGNYNQRNQGQFYNNWQDQYQPREPQSSKFDNQGKKRYNQKAKVQVNRTGKFDFQGDYFTNEGLALELPTQQRKKLKSEVLPYYNEYKEPDWQQGSNIRPKKSSHNWNQGHPGKYNSDFNQGYTRCTDDPAGYLVKTPSFNLDEPRSIQVSGRKKQTVGDLNYDYQQGYHNSKQWMSETNSLKKYQSEQSKNCEEKDSKQSIDSSNASKEGSVTDSQSSLPASTKMKGSKKRKRGGKCNKNASPELDLAEPVSLRSPKKEEYLVYSGPNKHAAEQQPSTGVFLQVPSQLPGNRRDTGALADFDSENRRVSGFDEHGNRKDTGYEVGVENLKGLPSNRNSAMDPVPNQEPKEEEVGRRRNANLDVMVRAGLFSRLNSKNSIPLHNEREEQEQEYEHRKPITLEFSKSSKKK